MKNSFIKLTAFSLLILFIGLHSCIPGSKSENVDIDISFDDPEVKNILELGDQRNTKELYQYFSDKNPTYRYLALNALGSFKSGTAGDSLVKMLQDPVLQVRAAAAYAIGQIGDSKVTDKLIFSFRGKDTINVDNIFNANVLEAVGKIGSQSDLKSIATVKTYRTTDTLLLLGQARAIYRMALRNITNDEGTSRMVDLLYNSSTPPPVRLLAAHYIARAKNIDFSQYAIRLGDIFYKENNPEIKIPLITAFGNVTDSIYLGQLKTALSREKDPQVKISLIKALGKYPYFAMRDAILPELKDENIFIATAAAEVFTKNGFVEDVPLYMTYDSIGVPWQVKAPMCGAVLQHSNLYFTRTKNVFSQNILKHIDEAKSPYEKAAYVKALSNDPFNYMILGDLYNKETGSIVRIATLEGLEEILKDNRFFRAFGNNFGNVKSQILNVLVKAINSEDAGEIATAARILRDPSMVWKEWIKDLEFMKTALNKLKLPEEIETYNELAQCIAYHEDKVFKPIKPEYNNPINWTVLNTIGDSSIAAIKTTKGLIRVNLLKSHAPTTVAHFVRLLNEKYYNGKVFHRVVPNFVIQTGCPRGDGFGSEPLTVRSELSQYYFDGPGYVGMASAGTDTESNQWFITHTATPHLDGNYTIFGKVVEGMDVVKSIEQGDKINDIIFVK